MRITATERAAAVVDRAKGVRDGRLTITIGTGCCESTAPFLYEDFWPGPDQARVGVVSDVPVYAPDYLRQMYPDGDGVVIDVTEELADSMSIETEFGCRLVLRGAGFDSTTEPQACSSPTASLDRNVVGELPPGLRRARMR